MVRQEELAAAVSIHRIHHAVVVARGSDGPVRPLVQRTFTRSKCTPNAMRLIRRHGVIAALLQNRAFQADLLRGAHRIRLLRVEHLHDSGTAALGAELPLPLIDTGSGK